jgi:signal transduction histidine kinase
MANSIPLTQFAPAERAPIEILRRQADVWSSLPFAAALLNAVPEGVLVVNHQRQIVFASKAFRRLLPACQQDDLLGARPGEALGCTHACEQDGGCGTTEFCSQCGAALALLDGLQGRPAVRECRLLRLAGSSPPALDLRVLATPFEYGGERFCVFAVSEIGHEKRRQALERSFFHDLLNTAGGLSGLLEALATDAPDELRPDLEVARVGFRDMVDQIQAQRDLSRAEGNELTPAPSRLSSLQVLREVAGLYRNHPLADARRLNVDPAAADCVFRSDRTLLGRVLTNLVKNALEACPPDGTVELGCESSDHSLRFWVRNPGLIPRSLQLQIFNRSFSTKGEGRGLGTYAVKLLTEKYLGGSVSFTSTAESGTTFHLTLPQALAY